MKKLILLMIVYGWLHNAYSQSQAGLDQYYYMDNNTISFAPVAWYQANSGGYAEGRYNYEAENTLSVYAGKIFEKQSTISYSLCPMLGVVTGEFNGGAVAVNTALEYKKISFSMQSQYTFSIKKTGANFIYSWCDVGYRVTSFLSAGLSLQQTNLCNTKSEKGLFIKADFGKWALPFYIFNPGQKEQYAVLGLNFIWEHKKKISPNKSVNIKYPTLNYNNKHL